MYSAYSVQLAARLHFSAVQSSILGMMGTIGMSLLGIPGGVIIDKFGTAVPTAIGSILIFLGYMSLYLCYVEQIDKLPIVCAAYCVAATGSTIIFTSCIKTAALNFQKSRGTATSFPLAAFGLCALFFSSVATFVFPGDTASFLKCLAILTFLFTAVSLPFLRVYEKPKVRSLSVSVSSASLVNDERRPIFRDQSSTSLLPNGLESSAATPSTVSSFTNVLSLLNNRYITNANAPIFEEGAAYQAEPSDLRHEQRAIEWEQQHQTEDQHHHKNISGWLLFKDIHFWQLTILVGLVSGTGQMYIYSCGYCIRAITRVSNPEMTDDQVQSLQALQVAVISLMNCSGRLTSGFISDKLVKKYGLQRMWVLVTALFVSIAGHVFTIHNQQANNFWIISALIGFSYGLVFGVFPTIVSESFGLKYFSQNWGWVASSPVITSYAFNLLFGKIYDAHSDSQHTCREGVGCYSQAFHITSLVNVATITLALYVIFSKRHEYHHLYKPAATV